MKEKGTPLVPADKPEAPGPDGEEGDIPKPPVHVIDGEEIVLVCQVMLRKETLDGLKDEECLRSAPVGMAGLCELHYKEYLVYKINKEGLDPVEMYGIHQVKLILRREELEVPEEEDDEGEEEYKGRLIEIIKERIPIVKKKESDYAYYTDEDLETACSVLNEPCYPCIICYDEFPMDEMLCMPACGDSLCKYCFKEHFSITIREKSVKHFNCPICGLPDLGDNDQMLEMNLELFVALVKAHLDSTDYDLCRKKLADFNLSKEPGFVRCTHEGCGAGFINDYQTHSSADHYPLNHSSDPHHQFTIGSMVRIDVQKGDPLYGVVKWIGTLPDYPGTIAGVELERPLRDCTDGTWHGTRFFTCPPGKAYFCPLNTLKQDTRYMDEGQVPAHMRQDIDNPLAKYAPVTEDIDTMGSPDLFKLYIGDAHGIQGHHNSCYLDSTVFGLFALSDSFDELIFKEPTEEVGRKVKEFLWKGIVNPLRKYGLARYESIMGLGDSLEEFGRMKGAKTDEKDPEEFLNLLFKEVLHIPPFLTIKRPFGIEKEFFIQLFFEIDPNNTEVPKTEKLIAQMFHEQNISFTRVPSKLLLQMPRFGKEFKMYSKIIPSLTLDVKPLMDPSKRGGQKCRLCLSGSVSSVCYACPKELFNTYDPYVYYCSECNESVHESRKGHRVEAVDIKPGSADVGQILKMELLSVICVETSHYVCYTRSGEKWLFHDSMADRLYDMYNVPRVVDVTAGLQDWIYSPTASEDRLMNTPARDIPEYVRRFTQDIYMCVYVNPDLDMYGDNDVEESLSPNNKN
ncbi:PREDICTED: ubiquitin carboxyl-terminal hydrolase CYLD-like [Amphimedon queenslandica]|uniref:ubiquitinyl hydrolase 1 n=1 Tax=Amphimedon queenslandica TaxID=400682 RepID=A0AAN0IXH4_AMPQE|nr:PREDICTED: ubiquitin carboxyl-terminal hydrolase CYLD-like [Amphimedon queenslandica]|eukprot:XP_019849469.1 PREDICTED: ubiquitin carboxyl-terminal hydrolase CYLD-like [Amphimedon queenslandica]